MRHRLVSSERHGMFDRVLGLLLGRDWIRLVPDGARYEATAVAEDTERVAA